jgi:hypothetical protein
MAGLKKLEVIKQEDFRTRQSYMLGQSLEDAQLELRWRTAAGLPRQHGPAVLRQDLPSLPGRQGGRCHRDQPSLAEL